MTPHYFLPGCRVTLRHVEATIEDAYLIVDWRNSPEARAAFFNTEVVTPDTHLRFMAERKAHDLVFIAESEGKPIGMGGLTVDVKTRDAEWGRVFLDPHYRGRGYATDLVYLALHYAFELLRLDRVWADIWTTNDPILKVYDRVGLQPVGVNLPGHEHPGGDVITREFTAEMWEKFGRAAFERRRHPTLSVEELLVMAHGGSFE